MSLVEGIRGIISQELSVFIAQLLAGILLSLFVIFLRNFNPPHFEICITTFVILTYMPFLWVYFYKDGGYFENTLDTFYFTHNFAVVEALIVSKMPNLSHRTTYRILVTIFRLAMIPFNEKHLILNHILLLVISVHFDKDRENHDKKLFESHFYSQQQLNQFKDLVVNDIPDGILIVTSDLNKCLFANNYLASSIKFDSNLLHQSLEKFVIHETPSSDSRSTMDSSDNSSKKNLLLILQDFSEHKKVSFDFAYTAESILPQKRIFETKIMPLVWDKQSAIAIIFHDITEQNTILELKIAANIHKDRILATVSHELRTPLSCVLGMVEIMESSTKDQETLSRLRICKNSCHLLQGFVNSILDLNLIRANKIKINPEKIDFGNFLKGVLQLFEFQCTQKGITLTQKIHPSMSKFIITDKDRLSQILINLIGNALKFTFNGGITIKAEERVISGEDYIELSVEDTGIGIKLEDQEKLFKMFGKVENSNTIVNKHGVGLGLTISNDLSKLLCKNGKIAGVKVKSEVNKGSQFSFLIRKNLTVDTEKRFFTEFNLSSSLDSCSEISYENPKIEVYQFSPTKTIQLRQKLALKKR